MSIDLIVLIHDDRVLRRGVGIHTIKIELTTIDEIIVIIVIFDGLVVGFADRCLVRNGFGVTRTQPRSIQI